MVQEIVERLEAHGAKTSGREFLPSQNHIKKSALIEIPATEHSDKALINTVTQLTLATRLVMDINTLPFRTMAGAVAKVNGLMRLDMVKLTAARWEVVGATTSTKTHLSQFLFPQKEENGLILAHSRISTTEL